MWSALLLPMAAHGLTDGFACPKSAAWGPHAWAKVSVLANAPCDEVVDEMMARVSRQPDGWHDPHNNGTYALTANQSAEQLVSFSRTTGNKRYTDKMTFHYAQSSADSTCTLYACSESQVTSVADFGTNYCNLRMLYCGSHDGCKPVLHDITTIEQSVKTSSAAAQHDLKLCLTV